MNVNRVLEVRDGDTLKALRQFLDTFWEHNGLDILLAPLESFDHSSVSIQQIENRRDLERVNPFAPVMMTNAARFTSQEIQDNRGKKVAAILRPCELRAFIELQKRKKISLDRDSVVILGVDCIGTFPMDVYSREKDARYLVAMTEDILRNAAEGALRPQQFRTACQVCDWPAPCGADIAIGSIGVSTDKYLLIIAQDEAIDARLGLDAAAQTKASEYQVSHRETVVGAIADMRSGVRKKLVEGVQGDYRFSDLASFLAWFANCSLCGKCLEACPLYEGEFGSLFGLPGTSKPSRAPLAELVAMSRWLASCAGCGMCEQSCTCDVPLTLLISALSHRVRGEMQYRCGDPAQKLPWTS
jgi:formate dehydrogenase (coenzyme F420) beta subunit